MRKPILQQQKAQEILSGLKPLTQDITRISQNDFASRHNQARLLMAKAGVDTLFLSGSNNLRYFCGMNPGAHDRLFAMFLPQKGDPAFICSDFEKDGALELIRYGNENIITWMEYENPFKISANYLKEHYSSNCTIGIDSNLPYWYFSHLHTELASANFVDAEHITISLRIIKSEKEIALIRKAVEIAQRVHTLAFNILYEGMSQDELNAFYAEAHKRLGGSHPWGGGSIGPASSYVHGTTKRWPLENGSVILGDTGSHVDGYYADVSRSIVFGKPSNELEKMLQVALEAQQAGIDALRPGVECQAIDLAVRNVVEKHGYGEGYTALSHRAGHGLGLDVHEPPYLVEGCTDIVHPGMTFAFDGALYIPGKIGVRFEDSVVVTSNGCEVLGKQAYSYKLEDYIL